MIGKTKISGGQTAPAAFVPFFLLQKGGVLTDSFLRRLDPRVKLLLLPLLVITSFAAPSLARLAILLPMALALLILSRVGAVAILRPLYMLRWLFLCTILLHLFFTPGRTLLGVGWLSLDGLLIGLLICLQLLLAITFSSLLTLTTTPEELVGGGMSLLYPLRRFGVPVQKGGALLLLVLQFIPILADEVVRLLAKEHAPKPISLVERLKALLIFLETLLLRLVERAEEVALARVTGHHQDPQPSFGAGGMSCRDRLVLLAGLGFLVFLWVGLL